MHVLFLTFFVSHSLQALLTCLNIYITKALVTSKYIYLFICLFAKGMQILNASYKYN